MAANDTKEVKPKGTLKDPGKENKGKKTQAEKKQEKLVEQLFTNYTAQSGVQSPVTKEFIQAALDQGLNQKQIKAILNSGALAGPITYGNGADSAYSNPEGTASSSYELANYFAEHPEEIGALFDAVKATATAPGSYAEYLAAGGQPGGYQSADQLLQASVLGIGGAKDAYLAGTNYAKYIAEGNDPNRWVIDRYDWIAEQRGGYTDGGGGAKPTGPSYVGGFDVPGAGYDYEGLNQFGMGDVLSHFMQAQQNKALVEQSGAFFDTADLATESEA